MSDQLQLTPLHPVHLSLKAQMIPFAGWEMPARYGSAIEEHYAVRNAAGMFDVSHMGRLYLQGPGAQGLLDRTLTADVATVKVSRARYCMVCREDGGILDDLIVYRLEAESYLVVCNAVNREVILSTFLVQARAFSKVDIEDRTSATAMIALQGPRSLDKLEAVSSLAIQPPPAFTCSHIRLLGRPALVARTGYTGEDGVELILDNGEALKLWRALLDAGVAPCGLVARDSLRLEAGLRLWGNDMDTNVNPFEAGLGGFVNLDKGPFPGKEALVRAKAEGVAKKLIGFEIVDRGIPRHGFDILHDGHTVGKVTSGGHSPTLSRGLGMGYLPTPYAQIGTPLAIDIRGRQVAAVVVSLPFYRRPSAR